MLNNTTTPPIDQLPPAVAEVVAPAAEAVARWRSLQQRHRDAMVAYKVAQDEYAAALAAAAQDDTAKLPEDRRPALRVEADRAEQLAQRAKRDAAAAWHHMSAELRGMSREELGTAGDAADAAEDYAAAIDALEAARARYWAATAVSRWVGSAVGLHYGQRPDAQAPSYAPRTPPELPRTSRGGTGLPVADVLAALRLDAAAFEDAATVDDRTQRWLDRNPEILDGVRERAEKSARQRVASA